MRRVSLILLTLFTSAHIACSYPTDFVVVNKSAQPVEVRYKFKGSTGGGTFTPSYTPALIATSQLSPKGGNQWRQLSPAQYQVDQGSRTVVVRVMPDEALRVFTVIAYGGHEDAGDAEGFLIEEISIKGARGGVELTGELARTTFSDVSRALYTLTYE